MTPPRGILSPWAPATEVRRIYSGSLINTMQKHRQHTIGVPTWRPRRGILIPQERNGPADEAAFFGARRAFTAARRQAGAVAFSFATRKSVAQPAQGVRRLDQRLANSIWRGSWFMIDSFPQVSSGHLNGGGWWPASTTIRACFWGKYRLAIIIRQMNSSYKIHKDFL